MKELWQEDSADLQVAEEKNWKSLQFISLSWGPLGTKGRLRALPCVLLAAFIMVLVQAMQIANLRTPSFVESKAIFNFETITPDLLAAGADNFEKTKEAIINLKTVLIDDYVKWHNETITKLRCDGCEKPRVRKMVFRGHPAIRGMGDQFRGMLHTYLCAVASGRLFLIDRKIPFPISAAFGAPSGTNFTFDPRFFGDVAIDNKTVFGLPYDAAKSFMVSNLVTNDAEAFVVLDEPIPHLWHVLSLPRSMPTLNISRRLKEVHPTLFAPKEYEFLPLILQAVFQPTTLLRQMLQTLVLPEPRSLNTFWRSRPAPLIDLRRPYISVHARLGIGTNEAHQDRFNLSKKGSSGFTLESTADCMAREALKLAKQRGIDDPPRFFLATDTDDFKEMFKKSLRSLDRRTELIYGSWTAKHFKRLKQRVEGDKQKFLNLFMDIFLLSKGEALLHIKSGFANLAVWMGGIRHFQRFEFRRCR